MGLNTEPQINGALARALCKRHPLWDENTVHTEQRQVLQNISKQPDILIELPYCQPVIIETEVLPANSVEKDAKNRLGGKTQHSGKSIESTLAVVLPKRCRDGKNNLNEIIESATDLKYCTFNKTINDDSKRYPESESDWIVTDINGLADAIEHLSISERRLEQGTQVLEQVVHQGAELLADHVNDFSLEKIANELHQEKCEQTARMATAIFVSAFVFHTAIEGQKNIPTVPLLTDINKNTLIKTWDDILAVNYYPIFSIARSLLQHIYQLKQLNQL